MIGTMEQTLKELTVEVKPTPFLPGEIGLFAARDIKKGEKVCPTGEREDEVLTMEEYAALSPALQAKVISFCSGRAEGFIIEKGMDFNELTISHFCNHSCEGVLGFDEEGDFVAMRDIKKGEELVYDYGLVESRPDFSLECRCGSAMCRKRITGDDWKDPAFQARLKMYIYPDLRIA